MNASELKSISDSLRAVYSITTYPEHLAALFHIPN